MVIGNTSARKLTYEDYLRFPKTGGATRSSTGSIT